MSENMWVKLLKLDRRLIYWSLIILMAFSLFYPVSIPIPITKRVRDTYNLIENIPEGSVILINCGIMAYIIPEIEPYIKAVGAQLFSKDYKLVFFTIMEEAAALLPPRLQLVANEFPERKYGIDWVNLGYFPGDEIAVSALADDMQKAVISDYKLTPISELPIMTNIKNANDIDFVIDLGGGRGADYVIRQFVTRYHRPMVMFEQATGGPARLAFYPNVLSGLAYGIIEAAQYESLLNKPGVGVAYVATLSFAHIYGIILILIGNIVYFKIGREKR